MMRLKEGILGMAGALKRKGLMRVAFLQSAAANMSKDRGDDDLSDGGSDDDLGGELDPDEMLSSIQKKEGSKKVKLDMVHQQMVGTLQQVARGLTARIEMADKASSSKTSSLEDALAIAREESKALSAERDLARAQLRKAEGELAASEKRLSAERRELKRRFTADEWL